jgi:predicted dehydrogenase
VAFKRLHDGAIGDILAMHNYYNATGLWVKPRQPAWTDMEWQLRNWLYFTWLSGDHIVEQAVHTLDKMLWAMKDASPVRATGQGGRQVRTDEAYGHIWDHFSVVYEFSNGAKGHFQCRQQDGTQGGVKDQFIGTIGSCDVTSGSSHVIKGTNKWSYAGEPNNMYQTEHDELFAAIRAGNVINDGVRMCNSTMTAIMGRMAAYTGQPITWQQAMASKEDLTPAKMEFGKLPLPPVAMPGKTKFI